MLQALPEEQRNQLLQSLGIPPEQLAQISALMSSGGIPSMGGGGPSMGGGPRQPVRVQLTPDEEAKLDQLVQMGFEKMYALQVFLAVGKDVEMAASILFEGGMDGLEMDESGGGSGGGFADGNEGDEGDDDDEDEQMY